MSAKNNLMQNVIIIFLVTAAWDVILRLLSEDKIISFLSNIKSEPSILYSSEIQDQILKQRNS